MLKKWFHFQDSSSGNATGNDGTIRAAYSPLDQCIVLAKVSNANINIAVEKYSLDGTLLWVRHFPATLTSPYGTNAVTRDIDCAADGSIYVLVDYTYSAYQQAAILKLNANGESVWWHVFTNSSRNVYAQNIRVTPQGTIYATVYEYITSKYEVVLAKLNSAGTRQWLFKLATPAGNITPAALSVDSADNAYVGGYGFFASSNNGYVMKISSTGSRTWFKTLGVSGKRSDVLGVGTDDSGNVYVAGVENINQSTIQIYLRKYDSAGNALQTRSLKRTDNIALNVNFAAMLVSSDGFVNIFGQTARVVGSGDMGVLMAVDSSLTNAPVARTIDLLNGSTNPSMGGTVRGMPDNEIAISGYLGNSESYDSLVGRLDRELAGSPVTVSNISYGQIQLTNTDGNMPGLAASSSYGGHSMGSSGASQFLNIPGYSRN